MNRKTRKLIGSKASNCIELEKHQNVCLLWTNEGQISTIVLSRIPICAAFTRPTKLGEFFKYFEIQILFYYRKRRDRKEWIKSNRPRGMNKSEALIQQTKTNDVQGLPQRTLTALPLIKPSVNIIQVDSMIPSTDSYTRPVGATQPNGSHKTTKSAR